MDTFQKVHKGNSNLIQRVITAVVLIPVLLLLLYFANPWFWLGFVLLISLVAAREYCLLIPLQKRVFKMGYFVLLLLAIWACFLVFPYWQTVGLFLWLLIIAAEVTYPNSERYWGYSSVVAVLALILWPFFIVSLSRIYFLPQGKVLIVYLLFLVWAADIGAYFAGKMMGTHKLIPKVSPGKSWEGLAGGFILGLIVAIVAYWYFKPYSLLIWFAIALVTLISTVVGDLCISLFKRRCNLKDTGVLLPGHGGILDRLDSLVAAAPVFYFGLSYIPLGI